MGGMEERQTKTRTWTNPDPDQPGPGTGPNPDPDPLRCPRLLSLLSLLISTYLCYLFVRVFRRLDLQHSYNIVAAWFFCLLDMCFLRMERMLFSQDLCVF